VGRRIEKVARRQSSTAPANLPAKSIEAYHLKEGLGTLSAHGDAYHTLTYAQVADVVLKSLFDAATFLYATADNTPAAKTRAEVMAILSGQAAAAFAMNSQKLTGLAAGSAAGDSCTWDQGAIRCINIVFDGGGSEIADNSYVDVWIPWACTVMAWRLMADQAGAIKIDLWSEADGAANFPPADGNSITNAHEPEIAASDDYAEDDDVTDWSGEALAAETVLRASVDSCTTITKCTLALKVKVT